MSDEMVLALGRFVTEVGDIEYVMFETILAVAEENAKDIHSAFFKETFGSKVEILAKRLKHTAFDEYRVGVDHLLGMLRRLTPQRNNIIHGETSYIVRGPEFKILRVGFTRKISAPLKDFDFVGNASDIFTPDQIDDVTSVCIAIKTDLDLIRKKVVKKLTGHEPPNLTHPFGVE